MLIKNYLETTKGSNNIQIITIYLKQQNDLNK